MLHHAEWQDPCTKKLSCSNTPSTIDRSNIITIIIIAFKGAIRDFFTISNTYAQVARAQSCENHVQHIERSSRASVMLRATWYEGTAQQFCLPELKSHLFELCFIG